MGPCAGQPTYLITEAAIRRDVSGNSIPLDDGILGRASSITI